MANRISRLQLPHLALSMDRARLTRAAEDALAWRPPRGNALRLLLYRAAWAPLWVWSDVPAPRFRLKEGPLPPGGPAGDHFANALDRLVRRLWLQRALTIFARAAWLPLLVGCIWLAIELAGGPDLDARGLIGLGILLIGPAIVFAWLVKPSRRHVARMLDQSFVLQERMLTAHENVGKDVVVDGELPTVTYLQVADAANVISEIRNHPVFRPRPPVREIVLAVVCALVLAALFFMRGVGGGIPALASNPVPAFVPAAERLAQQPQPVAPADAAVAGAPTVKEVQEKAERSNQAQQDLRRLGDALSDQAVTREAAEAIQRGDYEQAADLIRQVGENADQLTQSARDGLADDLDQAANEMSDSSGDLSNATHDAADGLREGGVPANEGMKGLGDSVDQTASDIVSQQDLASEMSRASAAESSQSGGEAGEQSDSTGGETQDGSEPQGGAQSADGSQSGSDAQPGESGDPSSEGQPGSGEQQSGSASSPQDEDTAGAPGSEGEGQPQGGSQPGEGTQPGQTPNGQNGETRAEQNGEGGNPGAGAGTGKTEAQSGDSGSGGDSNDGTNQEASDPKVTENQDGTGNSETTDPRAAITLPRSPDAGGYQTGSTGGQGSSGTGGGGATSGGSGVEQGEVGVAGPDSNHVPSEYRSIVEAFFSDSEDS